MLVTTVIWALAAAFSGSFAAQGPDCLGHTAPEPRSGRPQPEMSVSFTHGPSIRVSKTSRSVADVGWRRQLRTKVSVRLAVRWRI